MTVNEPYKDLDLFELRSEVLNGNRPKIDSTVPDSYRSLIKRCWSQKAHLRPTFEEIVEELKEDEGFLTDDIEVDDFLNYVEYIDHYESLFYSKKVVIPIDKFIKRKTKTFHRISVTQSLKEEDIKPKRRLIYPSKEFKQLNKKCQQLVEEARADMSSCQI